MEMTEREASAERLKLGNDHQGTLVVVDAQTRGLIQRAAAKFRQRPTEAHRDELITLVEALIDLPTSTWQERYEAQIATSKGAAKVRKAQLQSVQSAGSPRKNKKAEAAEKKAAAREVEEAALRETEEAATLVALVALSEEDLAALSALSEEDRALLIASEE